MEKFEQAFEQVKTLVARFKENEAHYISSSYQEVEVRREFIDKFFIALGWDVNHDIQTNPFEQEVKVERQVDVGSAKKRADYSFFVIPNFREVRFIAEAKKPSRNLSNAQDYFQTARYGWNKNTPIALLTDFEEFHIIDCRFKPDINTALDTCIKKYHYLDYLDKDLFSEIYYRFSRDEVANSSLEKLAETLHKPRGKAVQKGLFKLGYQKIDDSFLEDLDEYRDTLARSFKLNNLTLNSEELTEATQRTLDRLVFLRFLEDKLIEPYPLVDKFGERVSVWTDFIATCKKLNPKYNGVVFKDHFIDSLKFKAPNETEFGAICEDLTHINSPYDFNAIPINILGSIYERFLGKVVIATDKRARVEEKPEVRKAGGVYYTPEYIVRYIVENTVGKLIEGKTPEQIAQLRFVDIACGSGSFLLGAYSILLEHHTKYYNRNPKKAKSDDVHEVDGILHLSLKKKQQILLNNIYGVDIDHQAVEVAQMSLYLKLLEDETTATANEMQVLFKEQILPDLRKNIVCGNSLIGTDILDGELIPNEEIRKLNPLNFEDVFPEIMKSGGFDAVIGNPPYVRQETLGDGFKDYAKKHFETYAGTADLYVYFFEKAHKLLRPDGYFGMICSNKFMRTSYGKELRKYLLNKTKLIQIVDFGELPVFQNAATFPAIFITQKNISNKQSFIYTPVKYLSFKTLEEETKQSGFKLNNRAIQGESWTLTSNQALDVFEKMRKLGIPLSKYIKNEIYAGIKTGMDKAFVIDRPKKEQLIRDNSSSKELIKPYLNGDDVRKYKINFKERYIIFARRGINIDNYPAIKEYLMQFKNELMPKPKNWKGVNWKGRKPGAYQWFEIQDTTEYFINFEKPKIIFPDISRESRFTFDRDNYYAGMTVFIIPMDDLYLLGLLNSKLSWFILKRICAVLGDPDKGGRLRLKYAYIKNLPIRPINFSDSAEQAQHDQMVKLVDQMLDLHQQLAKAKTDRDKEYLNRQIESTDTQIDRLVYDLYGLTEDEIKLVEEGTK